MHAKITQPCNLLAFGVVLTAGMQFIVEDAQANPTGMTVASGTATAKTSGSQLTITTGNQTVLNWQSFNIAAGETTTFVQPSAASVVVNNIHDANASQIYGSLQANGLVILMNPNGFYFGATAFIRTGGLIVSTANYLPPQNAGGTWEFNGPPPLASIVNYGQINVGQGGSAYFIGDQIENYGDIVAPGGTIGFAAGQKVQLSDRPDGRGLTMSVTLPIGSVDNYGQIVANAGTIALQAQVVNQNGILQADSVQDHNGTIELVASDSVNLGANSQILARGDDSAGGSAGGNVTLQSGDTFSDTTGSTIVTTGGANGGNGGDVEVSAPNIQSLVSSMNASASAGATGGQLLLDPININLTGSGATTSGAAPNSSGAVDGSGTGNTTWNVDVNTAFLNKDFSQITLEASGNITVSAGLNWDLSGSTGNANGSQLTLLAGGDITFGNNSSITDENNWSVTLAAGYNFTSKNITPGSGNIYLNGGNGLDDSACVQTTTGSINLLAGNSIQLGAGYVNSSGGNELWQAGGDITFQDNSSTVADYNGGSITLAAGYNFNSKSVTSGTGNIYLDGNGNGLSGSIQTDSGDINLAAGENITVGSGSITTTGGGNINAHALDGSIDAGSNAQGYHFESSVSSLAAAYDLSGGLGGIGTEAGGNVTLTAGADVNCILPASGEEYYYDGNAVSANNGYDYLTAGIGAYGYLSGQRGNVTIIAGGNVSGNYLVANGVGSIYAGVAMDANGNPIKNSAGNYVLSGNGSAGVYSGIFGQDAPGLALNLVNGGWNVAAARNIYLQEVRNPNGDFDSNGGRSYDYLFNYSPTAYLNLSAGNLVQLGSSSLPRINAGVPVVYPSILNITSGDGGVELGASSGSPISLTLFPSPEGSLTIDTTGPLFSGLPSSSGAQLFNLIVSDGTVNSSGYEQYSPSSTSVNFTASDLAATPVHLNSATAIDLNIGGDMDLINLVVPESAQINVGGNLNNDGFQGMNLSAAAAFQTTVQEADGTTRTFTVNPAATDITVAGDIYERGNFTSIGLSLTAAQVAAIDADLADSDNSGNLSASSLLSHFDLTGSTLTYDNISGQSLSQLLNSLNNLTVQVYVNGVPQWIGNPLNDDPETTTVSVFGNPNQSGTLASQLLTQYNALGSIPANNAQNTINGGSGFTINGGGALNITARTIDLGTSAGILSLGPVITTSQKPSYSLASLFGPDGAFTQGASINLATTGNPANGLTAAGDNIGDFDMFSSSVASEFGGDISLNLNGALNAGSSVLTVASDNVRGIYTSAGGDISIHAMDDININGSRIITYDGGNITVESLAGNVNCGSGSSTPVLVTGYYEAAVQNLVTGDYTYTIYSDSPSIPFSGIVAMTFPARTSSYPAPVATLGNILVEAPNGNVQGGAAGILQIPLNTVKYPDALTTVLSGYELRDDLGLAVDAGDMADATPVLVSPGHDIDFNGSGVIASNVKLDASGGITGFYFASGNLDIIAQQSINVTALGGGKVDVNSDSGDVSGTIVGVGSISVSGGSVDASLISANVSGGTAGQSGLGTGTAANGTSTAAANQTSTEAGAAGVADAANALDSNKKKGKGITLAQKVSRVTVLLPGKN